MAVESIALSGEPILLLRFVPPSDPMFEAQQMQLIFARAEQSDKPPRYLIIDLSQAEISFNDAVESMEEMSRTIPHIPLQTVHVGTSEMMNLIARTANQEQYSGLDTLFFPTVDEALGHVRSLMTEV